MVAGDPRHRPAVRAGQLAMVGRQAGGRLDGMAMESERRESASAQLFTPATFLSRHLFDILNRNFRNRILRNVSEWNKTTR